MLDDSILDEIFPVPKIEDLKEEKVEQLKQEGFVITNFESGGIFNMLLMIVLQIRIELIKLLRAILPHLYVSHATGTWLQLLSKDFSKELKKATKTCGELTISRDSKAEANTLTIPINTIFKTPKDINGEELRFFSTQAVVMLSTENTAKVPVEAEVAGSKYNLPAGQINRCMIHLEGIDTITNQVDWIKEVGADTEEEESLRERTLNAWAELSSRPIAMKYKNVCEAGEGVLYVRVDDLHPRGQGTIDIIVTSTAGEATESLLEKVRAAADGIKGENDNLLIKSAVTVIQDVTVVITLPKMASDEGVATRANAIILDFFKISKDRNLNELMHVDLLYALKKGIPTMKNVKITEPAEDVLLDKDKVIVLGNVTVTITREDA